MTSSQSQPITICPHCNEQYTRRVRTSTIWQNLAAVFFIYPFRCQLCGYSFSKLKWRTRYRRIKIDARHFTRVAVDLKVMLTLDNETIETRALDLSVNGCRISLNSMPLNVGDLIALNIFVIGEEYIDVKKAVVRFVGEDFAGLEFLEVGEMQRLVLGQFVVRQMKTNQLHDKVLDDLGE